MKDYGRDNRAHTVVDTPQATEASTSSALAGSVTSGSMSTLITRPPGPTTSVSSAALYPPNPISSTLMPGRSSACSTICAYRVRVKVGCAALTTERPGDARLLARSFR